MISPAQKASWSAAATDQWMSAIRAREAALPDSLIEDRAATILAKYADQSQIAEAFNFFPGHAAVILRRRFGDDLIAQGITENITQIVSLGAGSDTRAYGSIVSEKATYFEIDLPGQQNTKVRLLESVGLKPTCIRRTVETDLCNPQWHKMLLAAGFSLEAPTIWIADGLFYYLPYRVIRKLIQKITELSAHGSRLSFDVGDAQFPTAPETSGLRQLIANRGAHLQKGMEDPAVFLAQFDWKPEIYHADDIRAGRCAWLTSVPKRILIGLYNTWFAQAYL
ncbi:class I SAM-dependent methyltransferase [Streptomyces sp. NPDC001139]